MTSELLSVQTERDRARIVYRYLEGGRVFGPHVATRPAGENHAAYIESIKPPSPVDYQSLVAQNLNQIAPGTAQAFQKALRDLNVDAVGLGEVATIRVTQVSQTNPENVVQALRTRVDAEQGAGTFNAIVAKLKTLSFDTLTLHRQVTLTL